MLQVEDIDQCVHMTHRLIIKPALLLYFTLGRSVAASVAVLMQVGMDLYLAALRAE